MVEVLFVLLVVCIPPLWAYIGILVELLLRGRLQQVHPQFAAQVDQPKAEPEPIGRPAE